MSTTPKDLAGQIAAVQQQLATIQQQLTTLTRRLDGFQETQEAVLRSVRNTQAAALNAEIKSSL